MTTTTTTTTTTTELNPINTAEKIPGFFTLKNGQKVVQTSGHPCAFNDGTVFRPDEIEAKAIKAYFAFLTVERSFQEVPSPFPGIRYTHSSQKLAEATVNKLHELVKANPDTMFLVPFMVESALWEMGVRDKFPTLVGGNATPETSRETPDKKVWNLQNMAY